MKADQPILPALSPDTLWWWGRTLLAFGLALGLGATLYTAWIAPEFIALVPLVIVALGAAVLLFQYPLANLAVVLAGFVLITDHDPGIQAKEVLYGTYFLAYLTHWFFTRFILSRERHVRMLEEKALLAFLVWITASWGLTLLFDGNLTWAFSEWLALVMTAMYFPVKEAFVRYRHGPIVILGALLWIGFFVATRNLIQYQTQIALVVASAGSKGSMRVMTNDNLLMIASVIGFTLLIFSRSVKTGLASLAYLLLVLAGLILTLSRTYWITFVVGAFVLFLLADSQHRRRIFALGAIGACGLVVVGAVFFGDVLMVIFSGLVDRLSTLSGSATRDISLLSRVYESRAVFERILSNPVLGYGPGVPFHFYDVLKQVTLEPTFIHNGYLSLWYRFGLIGLLLVLFVWSAAVGRGVRAFRVRTAPLLPRLCAVGAVCVLSATTLSALTSNPFHLDDSTFLFGLLTGMAGGAWERVHLHALEEAAP